VAQLILVTGGTGSLGRVVVDRLVEAGHGVRVASRHAQITGASAPYTSMAVDLLSGERIDQAVEGADAIVHCASDRHGDVQAARNLIAAAQRAGSPHLIYISIVGVDQVPFSYYRAKLEVERLIEDSGLPWTVLRATQFHDLILRGCAMLARPPVMVVPAGTSFQPIDIREVARHLVEFATGTPAGRAPDIGGPQVRSTRDLARSYLEASGRHRPVLPVRFPGPVFSGYRRGGQLTPDRAVGRITFEECLAERISLRGGAGAGSAQGTRR
jgi:uncharacterized protein YbjT (DUF2867 family)